MSPNVFAYGSNMCSGRLRDYGVFPEGAGATVLSGHRLVFNKKSTKDNSGKANVEPCVNSYVWGVLYAISDADLHRLEGEMGYRRVQSHVQRQDGASIDAWLYVASVPDSDPALRPYFWYKRFLVEGAREHALPAEFSLSIGCELKI
jgi:gamma-glutamylcyclotransferase